MTSSESKWATIVLWSPISTELLFGGEKHNQITMNGSDTKVLFTIIIVYVTDGAFVLIYNC